MQSYDFLMLAVVLGCMVFGAWKGMAWQVASLASIVASYFVAVNFSAALAPAISSEAPWNKAVAMLILYVATSIGIWLAFRLVRGFIDSVRLREFDRQIGAMFGAAKGVLLCLVITFFALSLSETARGMVHASRAGYYMTWLLKESDPYLPTRVREVLGPYIDQLEDKLQQGSPTRPAGPPTPGQPPPAQPLPGSTPQPSRPFPNLLSGPSGGYAAGHSPGSDWRASSATGEWRPNTGQPSAGNVGNAPGANANGPLAGAPQPGSFAELGGRLLRDLAGGEPTSGGPNAGRIANPSYGQPMPKQPGPSQPPPDDWNTIFSRGLDVLRTLEEFGTSPSTPQRR
jgi:membrane protein required for colicin V production